MTLFLLVVLALSLPSPRRARRAAMANAHLHLEERIEMEAALRAGDTQAIIAIRLARFAGTISRELELCDRGLGITVSPRRIVRRRAGVGRRDGAIAPSTSTRRCGPKFTSACIVAGLRRRSPVALSVTTRICL